MKGYGFPCMEEIVAPGKRGIAEIIHNRITPEQALMAAKHCGHLTYDERGGTAVLLRLNLDDPKYEGQPVTMMSDVRYERETCHPVLREARGDVLIAGLGLGMILHPICADPRVRSVTVVEKYPDVIELVSPTVPKAVQIVNADIFEWDPHMPFHTVWFDIWPDFDAFNLIDMATLHFRYAPYMHVGGWMESWQRELLLNTLYRGSASLRNAERAFRRAFATAAKGWST